MGKAVCLSFDHKAKSLAPRLKVLRLFVSSPEAFISSLTFPLLMGVEGTAGVGVGGACRWTDSLASSTSVLSVTSHQQLYCFFFSEQL